MSAKVIDLADYRRKKAAERGGKRLRGLGFPEDFSPFNGPDDQPEDFNGGLFSGLKMGLGNVDNETEPED